MTKIPSRFCGITSSPGRLELDDRLIFLHFPKAAGTTVYTCLARLFKPAEICPERNAGIALWPENALAEYKFFTSHSPFRDHRFIPKPVKFITFLRHPVERSISNFQFYASHTDAAIARDNLRGPRLAKSLGLRGFFSEENYDQCSTFWNTYTTGLSVDPVFSPSGKIWDSPSAMLEHAVEILDSLSFVGISEDLATSFVRMSEQFDIPNLYSGQTENVTSKNHALDPHTFDDVERFEITDEILATVSNANRLDSELYKYALQKFLGGYPAKRKISCIAASEVFCRVRVGRSETWIQNFGGGYILYGPYIPLLPSRYKVDFRFRCPIGSETIPYGRGGIGFVEVVAHDADTLIARAEIDMNLSVPDVNTISVEFKSVIYLRDVEFRFFANPGIQVEVDQVITLFRLDV